MIITAELRLQFLTTFGFNPEDMPVLKELNEENEQLKEQIESLKCCGNCLDGHDQECGNCAIQYPGRGLPCRWQPKEKK